MKVRQEEIQQLRDLVQKVGGPEVKAKDVWEIVKDDNPRLMGIVREYATKVKFGVFCVDEEFLNKAISGVAADNKKEPRQPKPPKEQRVVVKNTGTPSQATIKIGKREQNQLQQLANAQDKIKFGEIMYEDDLIKQGAQEITRDEAKQLMLEGKTIFVVDRSFTSKIAVPPMAYDLVKKSDVIHFYKL